MQTEAVAGRPCRRVSADFGLIVLGCACALAVWAKDPDVPVGFAAPKPVVIQPSVVAAQPASELSPPQPEASARAKPVKAGKKLAQKSVKPSAKVAAKPVAKAKPKPKRR